MIDKIEIVRQFLEAGTDPLLDNIAVNRLPVGYENTVCAVVLTQETGAGHVTGADYQDVIACRCYGGSGLDSAARAVWQAIYDRLFLPGQTTLAAGNIKQVFYLSDFAGPDDPDHGWPNHIGRFQIFTEAT